MLKNISLVLLISLLFLGCSKDVDMKNVEPKLVIGNSLKGLTLQDQFEKKHTLKPDTYKLIFAFAKESAHTCNDFFNTQKPNYLAEHHTQFIADVSAAPSLIRSMFILPGLKDFKHTVLLLDTKEKAAPFRKGMDTEAITVVTVINKQISDITTLTTTDALQKVVEDDSAISYIAPVINTILN